MFEKLNNYFRRYKPQFKTSLSDFFEETISNSQKMNEKGSYTELIKQLKNITCDSGKMFRPLISLCFFQMISEKEPSADEIKALSTLELIHKFLLIHDDVADNDKQRYSKPNLYGIYCDRAKKEFMLSDDISDRYGLAVSMIAGDLNHDFVYKIINDCNLNSEIKVKVLNEIHRIINLVSLGWKEEYDFTHKKLNEVSEEEVLSNLNFITSAYTTEGPARFGCVLAGSFNTDFLLAVEKVTIPLGKAFQITDDLHGTFNEENGQSIKSDISEGKKTLHLVKAYSNASEEDKKFLENVVGKKDISMEQFRKIRGIVEGTGAKRYAEEKAVELKNESLLALQKLPFENEYKEILKELCEFAVKREY